MKRELVVDIGSSHTVIASGRSSNMHRVPTQATVAVPPSEREGEPGSAEAPSNPAESKNKTKTVQPVQRGKVVDVYAMELVLKRAMARAVSRWAYLGLRHVGALLAKPDLPGEEISRLRAILVDVGFSRMHIIPAPFAAVRGSGMEINRPEGRMLVDLGGGKARFSVFTMGELAAWWQADFGGQDLDAAIVQYMADRYRRSISLRTAEEIKLKIGSVYPMDRPQTLEVTAYDPRSGEGKRLPLSDSEIRDVLIDACETLLMDFQSGFEDVAPELAGDIARYGVALVGGCSLLRGLPEFLGERTGLVFTPGPDPINANVRGAQNLLMSGINGRKQAG